jgi:HAMP domain-containing protein
MMIIFSFFSIISVAMVTCFSIALLNVVIRRESAYLVEERIKVIVESRQGVIDPSLGRTVGCEYASNALPFALLTEQLNASWPGSRSVVSVLPMGDTHATIPPWLGTSNFAGIVADRGKLEIRFQRMVKRSGCYLRVLVSIPLGEAFLGQLSTASGLEAADGKPIPLPRYRQQEGMAGEILANFVPGSQRPVPVVVVARDWQSGEIENWVIYQVRPSYSRTIEDLSHMGLRRASWIFPLLGIGSGLLLAYACGLVLSVRLSRRIVTAIDALSHAAGQVGKGDFSVSIPKDEDDQLGLLATSFNSMTAHLRELREQERQRILLERDITLAQEAQQYLYPRFAPVLPGMQIWGQTTAARIVSGDLYDFFQLDDNAVGLLCADVSGKGMSAALMAGCWVGKRAAQDRHPRHMLQC